MDTFNVGWASPQPWSDLPAPPKMLNGFTANGNGSRMPFHPKGLSDGALNAVAMRLEAMTSNNSFTSRGFIQQLLDKRRDYDAECGYPPSSQPVNVEIFREGYDRDPIANRVTEVLPMECWQVHPRVYEEEDSDKETPFEEAWDDLGRTLCSWGTSWHQDEEGSMIWPYLLRADVRSGIGHFGVMLLGIDDGRNLQEPVEGAVTFNWESRTIHKEMPVRDGQGFIIRNEQGYFRTEKRIVGMRLVNIGNSPLIPDSPITPEQQKSLLEDANWKKKVWNQKEGRFDEVSVPPLSKDEKLIVNQWGTERDTFEERHRQYRESVENARKGRKSNPNSRSTPNGSKGPKSSTGSSKNPVPPTGPTGPYGQLSGYAPTPGFSPLGADGYSGKIGSSDALTGLNAHDVRSQVETYGKDHQPTDRDMQFMPGFEAAALAGRTSPDGSAIGSAIAGTDLQYGTPGMGMPPASLSGTDQQYFGVQFGPSEQPAEEPAPKQRRLNFIRIFDESLVQVVRYEWNVFNPRFGQPVMYRITLNDPKEEHSGVGLPLATVFVHWTRIVHLADNRGSSEVFGVPRQRPVLNRLLDLRKLYGAGAEGHWQSAFTGLQFKTHPQLGGDVDIDPQQIKDTAENYLNSMQRILWSKGGEWSTLAPSVQDPSTQINIQIEAICIQLKCPVRVFKGSERGELASGQDDSKWNDVLRNRQNFYITPYVVCPFVDRLIQIGVLPAPEGYSVEWPDLESLSDKDKAGILLQKTQAYAAYAQGLETLIQPKDYMTRFDNLDEEEAQSMIDATRKSHEDEDTMTVPPHIQGQPAEPAEGTAAAAQQSQQEDQFKQQLEAQKEAARQKASNGEDGEEDNGGLNKSKGPPNNKPPSGSTLNKPTGNEYTEGQLELMGNYFDSLPDNSSITINNNFSSISPRDTARTLILRAAISEAITQRYTNLINHPERSEGLTENLSTDWEQVSSDIFDTCKGITRVLGIRAEVTQNMIDEELRRRMGVSSNLTYNDQSAGIAEGDCAWRTIHGLHLCLKGGEIVKGPKSLVGKRHDEITTKHSKLADKPIVSKEHLEKHGSIDHSKESHGHGNHGEDHHGHGHELEHTGHQAHTAHEAHAIAEAFGGGHEAHAATKSVADAVHAGQASHSAAEAAHGASHAAEAVHGAHEAASHAAEAAHGASSAHDVGAHAHGPADAAAIIARHAYGPALKAAAKLIKATPGGRKVGEAISALHEGATKLAEGAIKKMADRYGHATTAAILGAGSLLSHSVTGAVGIHGPAASLIPAPHLVGSIPLLALAETGKRLGIVGHGTKLEKSLEHVGTWIHAIKSTVGTATGAAGKVGLRAAKGAGTATRKLTGNELELVYQLTLSQLMEEHPSLTTNASGMAILETAAREEVSLMEPTTNTTKKHTDDYRNADKVTLSQEEIEEAAKELAREMMEGYRGLLKKHKDDLSAAQDSTTNAKDNLGHGSNPRKMSGYELVPGVSSVKKSPDYVDTGTVHVTLDNGDVHPIFYDRQSGMYWHANHVTDDSRMRGYLGSSKSDVLPNLVKRSHELTPN